LTGGFATEAATGWREVAEHHVADLSRLDEILELLRRQDRIEPVKSAARHDGIARLDDDRRRQSRAGGGDEVSLASTIGLEESFCTSISSCDFTRARASVARPVKVVLAISGGNDNRGFWTVTIPWCFALVV
jgi:hypothetical protein